MVMSWKQSLISVVKCLCVSWWLWLCLLQLIGPTEPSCPSGSQPWASFHPSVRTASSPGFLRWFNGNRGRFCIRKLVSHVPSSFLSFSVLGKRQLYTQSRILATKSRQPVRSSVLEPWGEDRREPWGGGFGFRYSVDYCVFCIFFFCQV